MNKLWIEHSHNSAEYCRDDFLDEEDDDLEEWLEYLDIIGLFETSWLIYGQHKERPEYGYPNNE